MLPFLRFIVCALVGLAVASPLGPPSTITCDDTNSWDFTWPACSSSCVHRFSYLTAYSSASAGMKLALDAFDARDWCTVENKDWCPETINTTVSSIAGSALTEAAIDFDNCGSDCMLISLAHVSQMAALWAMQWAETVFDHSHSDKADRVGAFHQLAWELSEQEPLSIARCTLPKNDISVFVEMHPKPQSDTWRYSYPTTTPWMEALPKPSPSADLQFLALQHHILAPFTDNECECKGDNVLCRDIPLEYLRSFVASAKEVLPKTSWLGSFFVHGEWSSPIKGVQAPTDPWANVPPLPVKPEAWQLQEFGRSERFNPATHRLEQQTLMEITDIKTVEDLLQRAGKSVPMSEILKKGFKPFYQLDEHGTVLKWKGREPKVLWHRPQELEPMNGEWSSIRKRFLLTHYGAPVLNSMGEPLVASEAGTMLTLQPVPIDDEYIKFEVIDNAEVARLATASVKSYPTLNPMLEFKAKTGEVKFEDDPWVVPIPLQGDTLPPPLQQFDAEKGVETGRPPPREPVVTAAPKIYTITAPSSVILETITPTRPVTMLATNVNGVVVVGNRIDDDLPTECIVPGAELEELEDEERDRCTAAIGSLGDADKVRWVRAVFPRHCWPRREHGEWIIPEMDDAEDTDDQQAVDCWEAVHDFNDDERRAWITGMMSRRCLFDLEYRYAVQEVDDTCQDLEDKLNYIAFHHDSAWHNFVEFLDDIPTSMWIALAIPLAVGLGAAGLGAAALPAAEAVIGATEGAVYGESVWDTGSSIYTIASTWSDPATWRGFVMPGGYGVPNPKLFPPFPGPGIWPRETFLRGMPPLEHAGGSASANAALLHWASVVFVITLLVAWIIIRKRRM